MAWMWTTAVSSPRVHVEADRLDCEGGFDPGQLEQLERRGERLVRFDGLNLYFGGANAVAADARRPLSAAGIPAARASGWCCE